MTIVIIESGQMFKLHCMSPELILLAVQGSISILTEWWANTIALRAMDTLNRIVTVQCSAMALRSCSSWIGSQVMAMGKVPRWHTRLLEIS